MNHVVLNSDPVNPNDATKKAYVDSAIEEVKNNVTLKNKTFANPVIQEPHASDSFPDPTIWAGDDGYFYSLATSYDKHLFRSVDLVNWEDCNYSPIDNDTVTLLKGLGYNKIWAPSVHKVGTNWLMYIAGIHDQHASNYNNDTHTGIVVLKSNKCNGYFRYAGTILTSTSTGIVDCIDPFLDYDPYEHKLELYFGSTGGIHKIEMNEDGLSIKEGTTPIHVAGLTISQDSTRAKVFEGAYVYYRGNYKYLFVSAGHASKSDYCLKVGRAEKNTSTGTWGPFQDNYGNLMTDGYGVTILNQTSGKYNGPGHNGNIFVDRLGKTYIYYHCHTNVSSSNSDNWQRSTFLQELKWYNNFPYFEGYYYFSGGLYIEGKPLETEIAPYLPIPQPNSIGADYTKITIVEKDKIAESGLYNIEIINNTNQSIIPIHIFIDIENSCTYWVGLRKDPTTGTMEDCYLEWNSDSKLLWLNMPMFDLDYYSIHKIRLIAK